MYTLLINNNNSWTDNIGSFPEIVFFSISLCLLFWISNVNLFRSAVNNILCVIKCDINSIICLILCPQFLVSMSDYLNQWRFWGDLRAIYGCGINGNKNVGFIEASWWRFYRKLVLEFDRKWFLTNEYTNKNVRVNKCFCNSSYLN